MAFIGLARIKPKIHRPAGEEKTCTKCKVPKPVKEFYRRPENKDGMAEQCKDCVNKIKREVNAKKRDETFFPF